MDQTCTHTRSNNTAADTPRRPRETMTTLWFQHTHGCCPVHQLSCFLCTPAPTAAAGTHAAHRHAIATAAATSPALQFSLPATHAPALLLLGTTERHVSQSHVWDVVQAVSCDTPPCKVGDACVVEARQEADGTQHQQRHRCVVQRRAERWYSGSTTQHQQGTAQVSWWLRSTGDAAAVGSRTPTPTRDRTHSPPV